LCVTVDPEHHRSVVFLLLRAGERIQSERRLTQQLAQLVGLPIGKVSQLVGEFTKREPLHYFPFHKADAQRIDSVCP
jgi:hypothetical protein